MDTATHSSPNTFLSEVKQLIRMANETQKVFKVTVKRILEKDTRNVKEKLDFEKRMTSKVSEMVPFGSDSDKEYFLLVRVSCGNKDKKKCSVVVAADALDKFWQDYASILKDEMQNMIKTKKKKKKKKAKCKAKAKSNKSLRK